jgi:signal transduction histidine kinase
MRRDIVLAAVTALLSAAVLWLPEQTHPPVAVLAVVLAQCLPLVLRRTRPQLCLAMVIALQVALAACAPAGEGLRGLALAIAVYTCGTLLPVRRSLALAVAATVAEIGSWVLLNGPVAVPRALAHLSLALLLYLGAAWAGQTVAIRRRYAEVVELRATEAATASERSRMARELHDVAAHHLTSLIVQATLVERLLDRDIEGARRGAIAIREEGKNTLRNLRMIVGTLRSPHSAEDAPVPGVADLADLAERHGAELTVTADPAGLSPAAGLTVYRVTQEALSNARDHAPGAPVTIMLSPTTLEVRNGPGAAATRDRGLRGYGLVGMRERATLIGAKLTAGPTTEGGWSVRLSIDS